MKKGFNKKNLLFSITAVCLVGLIGVGVSYAYYLANFSVSNPENANSDLTTTLTTDVVMDMQGKYAPSDAVPGFKGVKEVVVRGLGEKNSPATEVSIQITPYLGDFSEDVTWKLYKSDTPITCTSNVKEGIQYYDEAICDIPESASLLLEGGADSDYLNITVNPLTETKYYLVVEYANNGDQSSQMGKSFSITIGLGSKVREPIKDIIAQLDTSGKCPTVNEDGSVNVTGTEKTDGYLCKAKDAYGDSYYYRGKVTNNYVKFGKWSNDIPDVFNGYRSSNSSEYKEYSSLEECQSANEYNVNCTLVSNAGKDMYWRIVRINGDETVRVIYDGTSAHANGELSIDRQIGTSVFNDNHDDNAYVGYMYGDRLDVVEANNSNSIIEIEDTNTYYISKEYEYDFSSKLFSLKDSISVLESDLTNSFRKYNGYYLADINSISSNKYIYKIYSASFDSLHVGFVSFGTTSKQVAQDNKNDSTIKKYLDNWYKSNIVGTTNEQYVADNLFCNDRSFQSDDYESGYGMNMTEYYWSPASGDLYSKNMRLKCLGQDDAFSVSDSINGNGKLTYPIGLLTADEGVLADNNINNYLYSGQWWWTLSPSIFNESYAMVAVADETGSIGFCAGTTDSLNGVRPVLNLKVDVLNNGDGTMNNPYRLEN